MTKRTYRAAPIQRVTQEQLEEAVGKERGIIGVDLAKRKMVASFSDETGRVGRLVRFEHPTQTQAFVDRVRELAKERPIEVVLEATGTYGDPIRHLLWELGVPVFAVGTKRVHDAAEVFDGVPSLHDAKACVVMTQLHVQRATRREHPRSTEQREMRALVNRREIFALPLEQNLGRIESVLARHWPAGLEVLDVWTWKSALALLERFPGPDMITASPKEAAEILRKESRGSISKEKIAKVLESAAGSIGAPMTDQEQETLRALCHEAARLRTELGKVDREIERIAEQEPAAQKIASEVGKVTAVVLLAYLGPLDEYASAAALEKSCGLNLKIRSSGETKKGKLAISKRGPGIVRRYLYLAALRALQRHPLLRSWYQAREGYRADRKLVAVVALMRKLIRALWHVATKDEPFDPKKLVDVRRLTTEP